MKETVGILIDYGNSSTRFYTIYDKHSWYKELPNQYVKLTENLPPEYVNVESNSFKVNDVLYAQGVYVTRECSTMAVRPNSLQKKIVQQVTMLTTHLVINYALRLVAKYRKCTVGDLDVEITLGILLPAGEHNKDAEVFKAKLKDLHHIEAVTPIAFETDVNITKVMLLPEGAAAYMNAIYKIADNGDYVIRDENKMFTEGDLLVVDIGAGTTDIVLIRDGDLTLSSKDTMHKGGRAIESMLKQRLEERFEYKISDKDVRHILETGTLVQGTVTHDVRDVLDGVKDAFSNVLFNYLVEYIERHEIELRALKGLLVVGGGALETKDSDGNVISQKIADVLIKYIKGLTNTVALANIADDPRKMNIDGLRLYYLAQA